MNIASKMRPIVRKSQCEFGEPIAPTMIAHIGANHVPGLAKLLSDALMRAAPRSLSVNGMSIAPNSRTVTRSTAPSRKESGSA